MYQDKDLEGWGEIKFHSFFTSARDKSKEPLTPTRLSREPSASRSGLEGLFLAQI
jgi:hypothetical protein